MVRAVNRWLCLGAVCVACAGEGAAPTRAMRVADPMLLLGDLEGPLHLRVFAKGAWRCDSTAGQVLDADGHNALAALPGRDVTPAVRCGVAWSAMSGAYGTASPVDACFVPSQPVTVDIPRDGDYLVLVHGQGTLRLPDGSTRTGILGSACAEVSVTEGQSQSVTVVMREQRPRGQCGDGALDFDETCDLGADNGAAGSACSAGCQTLPRSVSENVDGVMRRPSVMWPAGDRLVVVWDVGDVPSEDVWARMYGVDGLVDPTYAAIAHPVTLVGDSGTDSDARVVPYVMGRSTGFVAAWRSQVGGDVNARLTAFSYDAPTPRMTRASAATTGRQGAPGLAVTGNRVVAAWPEAGMGLRAASWALARPLGAASAVVTVATGDVSDVRMVTRPDGSVVAVWSADGDVYARALTAMGAPSGEATRVNRDTAEAQDQPAAVALPDGTVVVAWRDALPADDRDGTAIRWARLGAALEAGAPHTINTTTAGAQSRPSVAVNRDAVPELIFVWQDDATGAIRGRLRRPDDGDVFSRIGASVNDFAIAEGEGGPRLDPAVTTGGPQGDQWAVAWAGNDLGVRAVVLRTFPH